MSTPSTVVRASGLLSTNAQIKVNVGFQPGAVRLVNRERGAIAEWNAGMPQNSMIRQSGAAANAFVTTSGVQTYEDESGAGFTIEPGAPMNAASGELIYWEAYRGDGPSSV